MGDTIVMLSDPRAAHRALCTGRVRTERTEPPDPRKPIAVVGVETVRASGLGPGTYEVDWPAMDRALVLAFEGDCLAMLGRIGGRRWRQGRARRVRMARKRRRGWA